LATSRNAIAVLSMTSLASLSDLVTLSMRNRAEARRFQHAKASITGGLSEI
jgi:hypothetical protein